MSYRNRKFWENVLNDIDQDLTARAAERMTRVGGVETKDIPNDGGKAVEIKTEGRKKSRLPLFIGIGAAAAAVALTVGLTVNRGGNIPVASNTGSTTDGTADSTTDDTVEIEWRTDRTLFEKYFMAKWENPEYEYKTKNSDSPILELNYDGYFGNICCGEQAQFYEDEKGCYMMTGGDSPRLYFVTKEGNELYDRTNDSEGVRYVRAGGVFVPHTLGSLGMLMLSEEYNIPLEILSNCSFTDSDGTTWYRNGSGQADGGNIVAWDYETDNKLVVSMPFHTEYEDGTVEKVGVHKVTFTANDGEWAITDSAHYDISSNTKPLTDFITDESWFDTAIFEQSFAGSWSGSTQWGDETKLTLDYHSDLLSDGFYGVWERYDRCYQGEDGFYIEGFAGGAGQMMFIPGDDPETLYFYQDIFPETTHAEPTAVYRRTSYPALNKTEIYGRLNTFGAIKLYQLLENLGDGFDSAYEQAGSFEDEDGEWSIVNITNNVPISDKTVTVFEFSDERIELGVPFVREIEDEMGIMLVQKNQVLVFEKQDGVWQFVERRFDARVDNTTLYVPQNEQTRYYNPYTDSWADIDEIEYTIEMMQLENLTVDMLSNAEFVDSDGKRWTVGGNGAPYPIYRLVDISSERIVASAPFSYDDGSLGAWFRIIFEKSESGEWEMTGVQSCDPASLTGTVPTVETSIDAQFNEDIFKNHFGGKWVNTSIEGYPFLLTFDYTTMDWGLENWSNFGDFFEDENGWYFGTATGIAGSSLIEGSGHTFFIPREDPETMYLYSDWHPELSYDDYAAKYVRNTSPDSTWFSLDSGKPLNVFGKAALYQRIGSSEIIADKFNETATITFEDKEWTRVDNECTSYFVSDFTFDVAWEYTRFDEALGQNETKRFRIYYWNKLEGDGLSIYEEEKKQLIDSLAQAAIVDAFSGTWKDSSGNTVSFTEESGEYYTSNNGSCLFANDEEMNTDGVLYYIPDSDPGKMYIWYNCVETTPVMCDYDDVLYKE